MNFRWYLFWVKDFVTGSKVRQAYKDLINNYTKSGYEYKIKELLDKACKDVEYYKTYTNKDISEFPVINKEIIKENYDNFISRKYKKENLHKMNTSGSTGTPFTILQNKEKRNRVISEIIFFNKLCNFNFGEKQIYFRVWNDKNRKSKLKKILQNMVTIDISNLKDDNLNNIACYMKSDKDLSNILAYASTLDKISEFMIRQGEYKPADFSIKSIISSSEVLNKQTRASLKEIFGCSVISRYSNQENGILAQECDNYEEFHINNVNYYIEFLKLDSDTPAKEGELARIVVTDLYNYAMPMIRYDTGDVGIYRKSECQKGDKVISKLYGRRVDMIFNTKGDPISPYSITGAMWGFDTIKQFKFIQISEKNYKVIVNCSEELIEKEILIYQFKQILGSDADINIEYVNDIPNLKSGKFKCIENIMKKREC